MKRIHHAFTMIELLVVVAIIAVMAAIAVPNFLQAQTIAKAARVKSDHAVIVAALSAYHADYRAYPPNDRDFQRLLVRMVDYRPPVVPPATTPQAPTPTPVGYDPRFDDEPVGFPGQPRIAPDSEAAADLVAYYATPEDSKITWYAPDPTCGSRPGDASFQPPSPRDGSAFLPFEASCLALGALTTPVAYFTDELPVDVFWRGFSNKKGTFATPYRYINLSQVREERPDTIPVPVEWRFHLSSPGPTNNYSSINSRPFYPEGLNLWLRYDPTNGTISPGMIFRTGPSE